MRAWIAQANERVLERVQKGKLSFKRLFILSVCVTLSNIDYVQAVNQWVDEHGLPDREEERGGPKIPYEKFHAEAIKHATLMFADRRKHKTWAHKFNSIKAANDEEKSTKSNEIFHKQARVHVDILLAVFVDRVEKALDAFPSYIIGHRELVWDRLNEVIDQKIYAIIEANKVRFKLNTLRSFVVRHKNC